MKLKTKRILVYIFTPFIFAILGYLILVVINPLINKLQAYGNLIVLEDKQKLQTELKSIYQPVDIIDGTKTIKEQKYNEQITTTIPIKEIVFPGQGTHFANLSCYKISLDAPIYWGDTDEILKAGVGQSIGSFLPGFGKTILLSGHNTTYFNPLKKAKIGDIISYHTNYENYEYKIYDIQILDAKDALDQLDEWLSYQTETLILYTCYPFESTNYQKEERLFLFADKISGKIVE